MEVELVSGKTDEKNGTGYDFVPTLLAMMPCPLKVPVEEDFARREEAGEWAGFDTSRIIFEGNATQTGFYEQVKEYKEASELPDLVISPGISSFFHSDFRERFLERGVFADVTDGWSGNPRFGSLELADPKGWYTVLCVNPLVMVVDHTRLGSLPVPRLWSDLLKPEYRKLVAMRGKKHADFCETTLLTLSHVYGLDAVECFGEAVKEGLHPAQMVKHAGTGNPEAAAVLIMPYFYSLTIPRKDKVTIVWPEEGAIASPVFLLSKASERERLKPLTDYLTGEHVSGLYESASFPALHPKVESRLPEGAELLWMGWDLVWNRDIRQVTKETHDRFMTGYLKGKGL
jgi:ABC-type Fe3+ transport system substrate-binding protein